MIPCDLGDEVLRVDRFGSAELAVPWTGFDNLSFGLGASLTWSVAPSLEYNWNSSTCTVSIYAGMDPIFEATAADAITKYVYANGVRIAKLNPDNTVHYFLADHLGSTRKVLDANRNTAFSAEYEPFGRPSNVTGAESYKYTMERHDDPTGLVYLRARQYDPEVGRFVSADPVLGSLSAPQTLNRYAYVVNNPLKYTDPTGGIAPAVVALIYALLIAGGVGVGVGVASHYVPEIRPYTNPAADIVSLFPGIGDAFALGYYGAQGGLDCAVGRCDPVGMGINLFGSVPLVGDLGKAVKYGSMGIGFLGLVTKGGRVADDLAGFGFKSLRAWKAAFGKHPWRWHHIVEQTPWNKARFGEEALHNINNMYFVPKSFHRKITKFYQSANLPFTNGRTFREFLADKSFAEQLAWGWWAITRLGG